MAADILAYRATHVPVGEDQKQHLELARDIAIKFNNDYAEAIAAAGYNDGFFVPPEPFITGPATRVMSLRDGTKKMSKSDPSDLSRINLTDDADTIAKKIRKAKTDPEPLPSEAKGLESRPEADNLVGIYAALAGPDGRAGAAAISAAGSFRSSRMRWPISPSPRSGRSAMKSADWPATRSRSTASLPTAPGVHGRIAAPIYREVKKIVGFIG